MLAAIGFGIQALGAVSQFFAEQEQEKAYNEYQEKNTQATLTNYLYQTRALQNRYVEEREASGLEQQQIYLANLQAKATAEASAASNGIEGSTIDALFKGYDRATAMNNYIAEKNLRMKGLQYDDELDSLRINAINSINLQQPYTGNAWGNLLGNAGSLLTSYANYDTEQTRRKFYKAKS